jgi:hypothetical protein
VAAGELTPEEALPLLDAGAGAGAGGDPVAGGEPDAAGPVSAIRLRAAYRPIRVVADPTVSQLHVEGRHSVRREGSVLVVSTPGPLDDEPGPPGESAAARFVFSALPRTIAWARSWREHQLTVRINPDLPLEVDVTGTDLTVTGCAAGLRGRLVASALKLDQVRGPLELEVVSSSVKGWTLPSGSSRLSCESSSVRLQLGSAADLRIAATNRMGRLQLPGRDPHNLTMDGETSEVTLGSGRDLMTVETVMSSVTIGQENRAGGKE